MQRSRVVTAGLIFLSLGACQDPENRRHADEASGEPEQISTATPQNAAEEEAIRDQERQWREALASKDTAAVAQFYTSDGLYLPQGSDGYEGRDDVGARWAWELRGRNFVLAREPKRVEVAESGDLAYEAGTYTVSWGKSELGEAGSGAGNYVTVWKKVDGQWKTAAYIWNRGAEGEQTS